MPEMRKFQGLKFINIIYCKNIDKFNKFSKGSALSVCSPKVLAKNISL